MEPIAPTSPTGARRRRPLLALVVALVGAASLVAVTPSPASARPSFKMPLPCNARWTTSTHGGHASQYMVDMVNTSGATSGTPVLASASGTVVTSAYFSDAGHMIVIDHGGGWQTRYLHLLDRAVGVGAQVHQGQHIGRVGNSGTWTTGAHLHFEQKLNGSVVQAHFDGRALPVAWQYGIHNETSTNCGITPYGKIGEKWRAAGGNNSPVGAPVHAEMDSQLGGRFQGFQNGMIIWHPDHGAHMVHGKILDHYRANGSETAWGFPLMDEHNAAAAPDGTNGRYQYFQNALILWSDPTGAHLVHGRIHQAFVDGGREAALGYPTMNERDAATSPDGTNGRYQYFQNALALWSPQHDAHLITGPIHQAFADNGREAALGYPTGPAQPTTNGGTTQTFETTTITWHPDTGTTLTPT